MSLDELISKREILAGMSAKKSKTLLFLIEKQTALFTQRSHIDFTLANEARSDRDMAFLQAFAIDNTQMQPVKIQQLESVFTSQISLRDRYHWLMYAIARKLESLPPSWLATLVTIALGLPQAFLALPIATAELGSSVTVILLIILGGINILTMICMAEAISRSQDFRSGNTFFKQLAANYLGQVGASILTVAVSIRVFSIVLACYIGLSTTMTKISPLPATSWAGLLFLTGLYVLSRTVIELIENQGAAGKSLLRITAGGKPQIAEIKLGYTAGEQNHQAASVEIPSLSSLRYAILEFPTQQLKELRVR